MRHYSITCKAGVKKDVRRKLGYHKDPGDTAIDAYGIDDMAYPVQQLSRMITLVSRGAFDPDAQRVGRWKCTLRKRDQLSDSSDAETVREDLVDGHSSVEFST